MKMSEEERHGVMIFVGSLCNRIRLMLEEVIADDDFCTDEILIGRAACIVEIAALVLRVERELTS